MAGVINIVTIKNTGNGFKGTLNANESFPVGGPGVGTSFSAKNSRLGATGYGGASVNNAPVTQTINNRVATGTNANQLMQNGTNNSKSRSGYFGTELTYEVDPQNLITAQFGINGNHGDSENHQANIITARQGFLQSYDLDNAGNNSNNGIDAGINYQLGFKANKNKLLTVSYRYYNFNNSQLNTINTSNQVNYATPDYRQDNNTGNRENTFQVDYVQQVNKLYIEGGLKGIWRNSVSNFNYLLFNPTKGLYEADKNFSDNFKYSQNVFGAYNSYRYSINSWSFSGGARVEQTVIDANFTSTQSKIDQSIFNVLPNLSINKEFKDKSSLSFGFNQRIKRPNIRRLNPFIDRSNPNFETTGNPGLRPVLNNNLQFSYSNAKKLSVNMSLGYSFVNNIDLRISTLDAVTNITRTTYKNTGKAKRLGLDYNMSYPFTNKWSISANGGTEYINISGFVGNVLVKTNLLMSSVSISTGYRFDKGWRLNGNVSYRSRSLTDLQGTANAFASTALSINKELVKNKLSFAAVINNLLSKYRYNITTTNGPNFTQVNSNELNFRSVNLSLNYNFGSLKNEVKKNRRNINNDDSGR
jgi:ferric enterobactin receptor